MSQKTEYVAPVRGIRNGIKITIGIVVSSPANFLFAMDVPCLTKGFCRALAWTNPENYRACLPIGRFSLIFCFFCIKKKAKAKNKANV